MRNPSQIVSIINMAVMVALIMTIILQRRGTSLSTVFGGSGSIAQTRRGFEKWLYYATIILATIFVGLSITALFLSK